jgi:hypothetical protein
MMGGRLSLAAVALVVAAMLLIATGSGQAMLQRPGQFEVQRADTAGFLRLGKERGYEISLYMPNDRVVILYVFRGEKLKGDFFKLTNSSYAVRNRGDLGHGVVRARFGAMGRVSLRFRPSRRVRKLDPQPGCEGGAKTTEYGRFVGHISFRGEGGYLHVSSPKGKAYIAHSPRLRCEKGHPLESHPRSLRRYGRTDSSVARRVQHRPPLRIHSRSRALHRNHGRASGRVPAGGGRPTGDR